MFLEDLSAPNENKKLSKLAESLIEDYGIDLSVYTELDNQSLEAFLNDLDAKKQKLMMESAFNSYHNDPEYTRVVLKLFELFLKKSTQKEVQNLNKQTKH